MWVDLFAYMFAQNNTTIGLRGANKHNSYLDAYTTLADPAQTIILHETCFPVSVYIAPGEIPSPVADNYEIGGCLSIEYSDGGNATSWKSEAVYAYPSDNNGFSLVGKKIRVRAIPSGPDSSNAPLTGLGSSGFIYVDTNGGGHNIQTTIVDHYLEGEGGVASVNVPLPWHEHTVTEEDVTWGGAYVEFVGIGSIGTAPDFDFDPPEFSRTAYEWQIWVEDDVENAPPPWWMCKPKEPVEPCPERPTGFVPFDKYDADFRFPLSSSRIPSKINRPVDCIACRPTLINVTPEEPE